MPAGSILVSVPGVGGLPNEVRARASDLMA